MNVIAVALVSSDIARALQGRENIVEFLTKKWEKENGYRYETRSLSEGFYIMCGHGLTCFGHCTRSQLENFTSACLHRLEKTLWCYEGNRIAVRFQYEWHDEQGQWYRSEGNEVSPSQQPQNSTCPSQIVPFLPLTLVTAAVLI